MPISSKPFLSFDKMWWQADKGLVHDELFSLMRLFDEKQRYHHTNNLMNYRLYGNANVLNIGVGAYMPNDNGPENRVTINLCQSVTDTVSSKLGSDNPNTSFLTQGGDDTLQRKAKKLEKFCNGIKYHTQYDDQRQMVFTDSCVWGTGCVKIYHHNGKIKCDRVLIDNIRVDDMDGMYGKPRNLYDDRYVARETLAECYPKYSKEIMKVDVPSFATNLIPLSAQYYKIYNQIRVIEAYRLPGESGKGGRHVISIENCDLIDEPWDMEEFPHVFFRWSPRLVGFYGQGIVEQVRAIQLELNKLLRTYQTSIHLGCVPYVIAELNSKFSSGLWSNEPMRIVKYQGIPPEIKAPNAVPPDLFNAINWFYQRAYEIVGVSMMDAQAKKPEGLDSGKAIREFHDIGTERFMSVGKRWEKFDQDCSKRFIQAAKLIDIEKRDDGEAGFEVCCINKKFLESIKWKEIDLDESDYVLQTFPTSGLAKDYSGRLSDVQNMLQAGLIPPEVGRKLLQFPDLESYNELADGPYDSFKNAIDEILEHGNYMAPEPFQLPYMQLGIQLFGGAYLQAKVNKVPEKKLALLRQWLQAATQLQTPPPPPMPPGPTPQANPMPPPQSNLIPNVPGLQPPPQGPLQ